MQFKSVKRTLYRKRQTKIPKNPGSVAEIIKYFEDEEIRNSFGTTLNKEKKPFFDHAFQNDSFAYCIFSSKKTMELIDKNIPTEKRHILMDATFRVVPNSPFSQLLIIYIRYQHKVSSFLITDIFEHPKQ